MKKIIVGLVATLVGVSVQIASATYLPGTQGAGIAVGTEWFFNQQDIPAPKTQAQCTEFWGQETYYLTGDADADGIPDLGKQWYFKDNFVYNSITQTRGAALILPRYSTYNGTTVSYHTPSANMLNVYNAGSQYPLSSQKAWYRYSKVAPLNQPVRAVTSEPLLMEAPTSRLASDAKFQIVYDVNFAVFNSWGTSTSDYFVATVSSLTDAAPIPASSKWYMKGGLTDPSGPLRSNDFLNQTTLNSARSINWSSEIQHGSECVNVTLKWCGDAVTDTTYGEECDLGSQNGQPGALCTATCKLPPIVQDPDVTILKTVVGAITGYLNNDIVTYRLLYRNIGTGLANNVVIRDQLPAGVTYVSSTSNPNIGQPTQAANILTWPTIATLAPGAQGEIIVQVRVTQFAACSAYTNTAGIAASNELVINNGNNNSSAIFTTECPNPDVVTQKSVSAISGSYLPGQTVEYTLTYQNIGAAVANGVIVTDTLPSQVTYVVNSSTSTPNIGQPSVAGQTLVWNVGSLNPGQSGQIKIRVTIKANTQTCTNLIVRNDFTISATNEPSTLLGNNPSNVTFPMQCLDLFSNKTVDKAVVVSGDIVTYTITYGNNGNVSWPGTVKDTLPAGMAYIVGSSNSTPNVGQPTVAGQVLTWNVGILPGGSSRTITIQARVLGATLGQSFLNTVCIEDDNNYNNNNCGNAVSVGTGSTGNNIIDLWSRKVVDKPIVVSGDTVTYTITYGNSGNVTAPGTVTDTIPAGMSYIANSSTSNPNVGQPTVAGQILTWNVGNLPAGSSRTITFRVRVIQATPNQQYVNLVCIADDNNYGNNNCGTATSTTTGGGGNNIDLWSHKVVDKPDVVLNDIVTYTITYGNSGNVSAPGIVTDTLPAGVTYEINSATSNPNVGQPIVSGQSLVWDVGVLPAGSSRTITFRAKISAIANNGQYVNLVCISDDNNFGNNNCGTATSCIIPGNIDLWSRKVVDKPNVFSGDLVTYTITYGNSGNIAASGTVTDTIPAGMAYVVGSSNSTPNVGQPTQAGQNLVWNVGTLPAGSSRTITFQTRVTQANPNQMYVNLVCIADDNNYNNNNCGTATSTTTGGGNNIDLWSNKVVDKPNVFSGDLVTYTITYGNSGNVSAPGTVTDTLPAGMTYVVGSAASTPNVGQPTQAGQNLVWNVGTLPAGSTRTITFQTRVTQATAGQIYLNTVCIEDDNNYNNNNCGSATSTTTGGGGSTLYDLSINKTPKTQTAFSGQDVTFTLAVSNAGPAAANGFAVNDYLPAGLEFVSANPGATYNPATKTITRNGLSLNANGSLNLTVVAKYMGSATEVNYAEICAYNGVNSGLSPRDIDSTPCNGTGNNEDDVSSGQVVSAYLDLNIDKLANGVKVADVFSGEIVDFSLVVGNSGTVVANNFSVNDYLPTGFVFVQASAGGLYNGTTRTLTWTGLDLAPGASTTLTFKATYIDAVERTNYAEVCTYNGLNGSNTAAKDIDSDPCNRGANPGIEDDESSAKVSPRTASNIFDLSINKLIDGVKNKTGAGSGQTFPITLTVTNSGGVGVSNFSVKDYMPVGLDFVSGSANPATATYDTGTRIVTFNSLNIGPQGTITLTFNAVYRDVVQRVNYTEICDYRGTLASGNSAKDIDSNPCNRGPNLSIEDDESSAQIGPSGGGGGGPTVDVTLNKLVNGVKEYQANNAETVTYTLRATNEGNKTITNVSIVDYLPANVDYVSGSATTIAPATVTYDATTRRLVWSGLVFTNNSAFDLTFRAVYNAADVRINYAEICAYNGKNIKNGIPSEPSDTDSDPCNRGAVTPVEDDESSALIRPKTGCTNPNGCGGGSRNYCGDALIARPNSYGQYEECDEGMDRTKPNYNGKPGGNCSLTCKTGGGGGGSTCGNGSLEYGEVCDQGKNGGKIPVGRPYAGRMCSSSCTLPGVAAPACDYIDPPSIMSNEYLPYRWDLEDIDNLQTSCTNAGAVIRDSLMCKFEVTDAKGSKVANANGDFTWIAPCHDPVADRLTRTAYIQVIKSLGYDPDSSQIRPYGYNSSKFNFTYLGEHKISMRLESYKMCVDGTNGLIQQDVTFDQMSKKRVCEMNFAVTKPYMVSRGPLGNFSTDSLTSFLYMPNGLQVFTSPVPKITQKFDVTSEVTASVSKLVNEYKKVSVLVSNAIPAFGTVSKVPGKDIYLFEASTDSGTIAISDLNVTSLGTKPFTIIVTRGDLIVKGNLTKAQNGMYINASQNGSIKFAMDDKPGVNGVKGCDVTQEVNGIFISVNKLISLDEKGKETSVANTDIDKDWCNGGDLTIRGVLIGNGINNIVNLRRSNVNTWFTELTQINADRKEYLLNHGAVVLKYNPTLFDNLPPGAEILSQVLNTYKK